MAVTYIQVPTPVKTRFLQAFTHWELLMISFNATTRPLPLPYCFRIYLTLCRLERTCSWLALLLGNLRRKRETNLLSLVDVWLRELKVLTTVQLFPIMNRFTIISRISSGRDSSLISSKTSLCSGENLENSSASTSLSTTRRHSGYFRLLNNDPGKMEPPTDSSGDFWQFSPLDQG